MGKNYGGGTWIYGGITLFCDVKTVFLIKQSYIYQIKTVEFISIFLKRYQSIKLDKHKIKL